MFRLDVTGPRTSLYTGLEESYVDRDPSLQPFTTYEYSVRSYNNKGYADSIWQSIITKEGPPEGVVPPKVKVSVFAGNRNQVCQCVLRPEAGSPVLYQ